MRTGARSPEELEMLLEDTLVLGDRRALADLFEVCAVLAVDGCPRPFLDGSRLSSFCPDGSYLADPLLVVQAQDTALVITARGANVARRGPDGSWKYAILHLKSEAFETKEQGMNTPGIQTMSPHSIAAQEGEARWWFGALAVIKATAADTGGQLTIVEVTEPPGAEGPLHVHHREDEAFWVLEGDVTIEIGDTTLHASAGDYAFGPRDIPHRYTVGDAGCRMLFICTPGGFEGLVRDMSEPAPTRELPPPMTEEPDWERVAQVAEAYGCELLG